MREFVKNHSIAILNLHREGVCGHLFEVIEYYYLLKDFDACIYLAYDKLSKEQFTNLIKNKYSFTDSEIKNILDHTLIQTNKEFMLNRIYDFTPNKAVILTEVHDVIRLSNTGKAVISNKPLLGLRCSLLPDQFERVANKRVGYNLKIFQDYRIYGDKLSKWETFDHKKRLLFSKYKKASNIQKDSAFIYLSTECRHLSLDYIKKITDYYEPSFDKIYLSVLDKNHYSSVESNKIKLLVPPIDNFVELFDTFIYVPLERQFDCSPRLVPECYFYGKKVILHDIDNNYPDKGLYWRKWDCDNNLKDLELTEEDSLIKYVKQQII